MTLPAATPQADLFPEAVLTEGEIRAWRRPPALTVSQWAEKHRVATRGQYAGPWRNQHTPYLREVMDTWQLPYTRVVSIMAPPQSGKTQALYNCWAYAATELGSPCLWVLPDIESAEDTCADLADVITSSETLRRHVTGRPRDLSRRRVALMGSTTKTAWSTSPKRLARISVECLFNDELGKWSGYNPDHPEASPSALARKRLTAYSHTRREMNCSSPTVDHDEIYRLVFEEAAELRVYAARCPHCGELQVACIDQVRWDPSVQDDPELVEAQNLAWYECEHCGAPWGQAEMRMASSSMQFLPRRWDQETRRFVPAPAKTRPRSVSFHWSSFYSKFTSLGEIASLAIKAGWRMDSETGAAIPPSNQTRDASAEHDLYNSFLALPYKNQETALEEHQVLVHCDESQPRGQVPTWCTHLTLVADVRKLGLEYTVHAWRCGAELPTSTVWAGYVESLEALAAQALAHPWRDADGQLYEICFGLVDSGYEKESVYQFCWAHPPLRPSKGQGEDGRRRPSWTMGYKAAKIDTYPGLVLYHLDSNYYKTRLRRRIMAEPGNPLAWRLHSNLREDGTPGALAEYARQLTGERMDDRGIWVTVGAGRHDFLDCEYGQVACADILGLSRLDPDPPKTPEKPPSASSFSRW